MKKLIILVTMAILSASPAIYATGNLQYSGTMHYTSTYMAPQVDYDGMAVAEGKNETGCATNWEFSDNAASYRLTYDATTDSLEVFVPTVSLDYSPNPPFETDYAISTQDSPTISEISCSEHCKGNYRPWVICTIEFPDDFFPRASDYRFTVGKSGRGTTPVLNARNALAQGASTSPVTPETDPSDSDPAPGSTAPVPAATTTTSAPTSDPMFTPAAPLPPLPQPGTTSDSGTLDSIEDYSGFANDDGSCQLIAGAIANPFGFIILAMALIPLAWRRKK